MLHARLDPAGRQRVQSFPGVQTGVRQWSVSALTSLVCPAPLRRSLSPVETANLESLIVALLEGNGRPDYTSGHSSWFGDVCVTSRSLQ
jgi:hypothetical protein